MRSSENFTYSRHIEERLSELMTPSKYLAQADCEIDAVYWGMGRSIGEVTICRTTPDQSSLQFEGLRNKLGEDFLFREYHYDVDPMFGTFRPFVKIDGTAPEMSRLEEMGFLLDQTMEVQRLKLAWLNNMPNRLRSDAQPLIDGVHESMEYLEKLKRNGFSDKRTLSFKSILEQHLATK